MLITYLIASLLIGLFMSFIWSSNGFRNTAIKTVFSIYTLWTAALLLGVLTPMVTAAGVRLF